MADASDSRCKSNSSPVERPSSWTERYVASIGQGQRREYDPKSRIVIARGKGARLWDVDGNEYMDLTCGYSATNLGHCFEPIVDAVTSQLHQLGHLTAQPHRLQIQLAEKLSERFAELLSSSHSRGNKQLCALFSTSGGRAVEIAARAARTFRPGVVLCLAPAFHGNTLSLHQVSHSIPGTLLFDVNVPLDEPQHSMSLSESFRVFPSGAFPYCDRCPLSLQFPACGLACSNPLLDFINANSSSISAILVEPSLGARGYVTPPDIFFQNLRETTDRHGILMIADEVQTGMGRCGDWLLSTRQGWKPDLVVLGKSFGGGIIPISAILGQEAVLNSLAPGVVSETFTATHLACVAALAYLAELDKGMAFTQANAVGERLRSFASEQAITKARPVVVGGIGASCTLEFRGGGSVQDDTRAAQYFAESCLSAGLFVHNSGVHRSRVVLLPRINMDDDELAEVCKRLQVAFDHSQEPSHF